MQGRKLWAFYPPGPPPPGVRLLPAADGAESIGFVAPPAAQWFAEVRPQLDRCSSPCYEIVQQVGEIVFVPAGWWHCVLNIDAETVAFTENVITDGNVASAADEFARAGDVETAALLLDLERAAHKGSAETR